MTTILWLSVVAGGLAFDSGRHHVGASHPTSAAGGEKSAQIKATERLYDKKQGLPQGSA
jgi:hypothetical protein